MNSILTEEYTNKFSGVGRLIGGQQLEKLSNSHVAVLGLGGVGSWVVEALARSGIGHLTLVDFDDICTSNFNRQVQAVDGQVGKLKTQVLKERIEQIHKDCKVTLIEDAFSKTTCDEILKTDYDYVVDAIDGVEAKCYLINRCLEKKIPVMTIGGAGGRRDPLKIRVDDLSFASEDQLLKYVRKKLRRRFDFPRDLEVPFGVDCVYSLERPVYSQGDGCVSSKKPEDLLKPLDCQTGMGTAVYVTGTFGFVVASRVVERLSQS